MRTPQHRVLDLVGGGEVLSEEDCWELLRSVTVGHVAVATSAGVDLYPVNFRVDDGQIVFTTNFGRKLVGLREGRSVFEAERVDESTRTGASVVVRGPVTITTRRVGADDRELAWTGLKRYEVRLAATSITGRRTG